MTIRLEVDETRCIGSGGCELLAPATFAVSDDGVSQVLDHDTNDASMIERAIAECPAAAIRRIEDRDG